MRIGILCHSLVSDWNHGNAHFLRGVARELIARGHVLDVREPSDGWSRRNMLADGGEDAVAAFHGSFPELVSRTYDLATLDVDAFLAANDLVLVHEWNPPELIAAVGERRQRHPHVRVLFHDTHHRAVTAPEELDRFDLRGYDGALLFGEVLREVYLRDERVERAWVWHEAADVRHFRPLPRGTRRGDLVWIGNWGDGERSDELKTYLIEPVARLGLTARVHGVRYPAHARALLAGAGIAFEGWAPNARVPQIFAQFAVTVHVPRRPYVEALPGIPTIRVFEALACGIPLVCSPWQDAESLFRPGTDYRVAEDGDAMAAHLLELLEWPEIAREQAARGLETIAARHTCGHRAEELMEVARELGLDTAPDHACAAMPAERRA